MSEAAVLPRGNAVALSGEVQMVETGRSDGRNRRAAETRRKIIAAAKEMIAETSTAPTVVAVAKRADVSVRSVFQHFGDVESLFVTVVDSVRGDLVVPPPTPSSRPLAVRITSVVENLAQIFDKIVPAAGRRRPVRQSSGPDSSAAWRRRGACATATFEVFAPEFAALGEPAREQLADAIGAALSLDAWIVLRRRDGLSFERATAVWRLTLTALLAHDFAAAATE